MSFYYVIHPVYTLCVCIIGAFYYWLSQVILSKTIPYIYYSLKEIQLLQLVLSLLEVWKISVNVMGN